MPIREKRCRGSWLVDGVGAQRGKLMGDRTPWAHKKLTLPKRFNIKYNWIYSSSIFLPFLFFFWEKKFDFPPISMSKYDDMIAKSCFPKVIYSSFPTNLPNKTRDKTLHPLLNSPNSIILFILHIVPSSSKTV